MILFTIGVYLWGFAISLITLACGFLLAERALEKVLWLVAASVATILLLPVAGLLFLIMDSPEYNSSLLSVICFSILYLPVIIPISISLKAKKQKQRNILIAGLLGIPAIICFASGVIMVMISRG